MAIAEPDGPRIDIMKLDPDGTRQCLERIGDIAHGINRQITHLPKEAPTMCGNDKRFTAARSLRDQHESALQEAHRVVRMGAKAIDGVRAKGIKAVNKITGADGQGADRVRDASDGK